MDDPQALLKKALQSLAALERLAAAGPAEAGAVRGWARGHFRDLLAVEQALREGAKASARPPSKAPAPGAEGEVLRSGHRATVRFRYKQLPEYLKVGERLIFREGKTKGIGRVAKTHPIEATEAVKQA